MMSEDPFESAIQMVKKDQRCLGFKKRIYNSRLVDPPGTRDPLCRKKIDIEGDPFDDKAKYFQITWFKVKWSFVVALAVSLVIIAPFENLRNYDMMYMHLWNWEALALATIAWHFIWNFVISHVVILIENQTVSGPGILFYVYPLRRTLGYLISFFSLLIMWRAFYHSFDKPTEKEEETNEIVTKIINCLILSPVVWMFTIVYLKSIEAKFYRQNYFQPVRKALFQSFVIHALLAAQPEVRRVMGGAGRQVIASKVIKAKTTKKWWEKITFDQWLAMHYDNVNNWRFWSMVKIIREQNFDQLWDIPTPGEMSSPNGLTHCENKAIGVARKIWKKIAKDDNKSDIEVNDLSTWLPIGMGKALMWIIGEDHRTDAESGEIQSVSKRHFIYWVVTSFKERRALEVSLSDTRAAFKELYRKVFFIVRLTILAIWLVILNNAATMNMFILIATFAGVALVVVGLLIRTRIQSVIYFLEHHPVDIGDSCTVEGIEYTVEEKNLLTTVFLNTKKQRVTYQNYQLESNLKIHVGGIPADGRGKKISD